MSKSLENAAVRAGVLLNNFREKLGSEKYWGRIEEIRSCGTEDLAVELVVYSVSMLELQMNDRLLDRNLLERIGDFELALGSPHVIRTGAIDKQSYYDLYDIQYLYFEHPKVDNSTNP
jgi:hypothetical protein